MQYKIVVDKQPMTNPSSEKKEYIIDIEELRVKGSTHDSLMFEIDKTYVIRRLKLSEYYVLSVLDEPIIEALESINIELFEGDNYIYLIDMQGNKFYAEYLIKNEFNDVFATRKEMNSAIDLTMQQITIAVNQKFTDYSTTEEMNAAIDLRANQINAEVEKKVDEETITGAYLILKINGDTSESKLNADKIEISANDILNLLAGNTINLTSRNLVLASTNFNVDKNGNMTCKNANITGGTIKVGSNFEVDSTGKMSCTSANISGNITSDNATINGGKIELQADGNDSSKFRITSSSEDTEFFVTSTYFNLGPFMQNIVMNTDTTYPYIQFATRNSTGVASTNVAANQITSPKITQTSLESIKKNINKFTKNATDIINKSDIYEYNLKFDADTDKKLIGFVIGDKYRTPDEVIDKNGEAVSLYSAIGILWKGFQEREEIIKQLKEENKRKDKILSELILRVEQLEKEVQHE